MDNNFNQNQQPQQNMYQAQPQQNMYQAQPNMYQAQPNMYQAQPQQNGLSAMLKGNGQPTNLPLGLLGAFVGAAAGTGIWIAFCALTGYTFFAFGVLISFLSMFLFQLLGKNMNVVGLAVSMVLTCIGIYLSVKFGTILALAKEFDCSYAEAKLEFKLNYSLNDAFKMEYVKNMAFSYICGIGYTIVMLAKKIKK